MSTAHRPTWTPAAGGKGKLENGLGSLSKQLSVRDQAAHTTLKYRKPGQTTLSEVGERDLKAELDLRESKHLAKRKAEEAGSTVEALEAQEQAEKRLKMIESIDPDLDADDDADEPDDDDSDDDSDDDDDDAEILRELQRIKAERQAEAEEREAERTREEEQIRTEEYSRGNPLLEGAAASSDFSVNRRWDSDTVFTNCAKIESGDKDFVNDTLRSTFHRRFMDKYVK